MMTIIFMGQIGINKTDLSKIIKGMMVELHMFKRCLFFIKHEFVLWHDYSHVCVL